MKRIPASVHRSLDMLAIIGFLGAPLLLRISGTAALLSYALAAVHLVVTLSTKFPDTHRKLISLRAHGVIELIVGVALIALPWLTGWVGNARAYYVTVGVILLIVWALSNYGRQYGAERTQRTQRTPRTPRSQHARG
jgi:uncharacterized membrane protein YhaH (DUF805 family)